MNGDENMHFPEREDGDFKWNFNTVVMIGGLVASLAVNAFLGGVAWTNLNNSIEGLKSSVADTNKRVDNVSEAQERETQARIERGKQTDAKFQAINDKLPQFDIIAQQILRLTEIVGAQAKSVDVQAERFERFNNLYGDKLDAITQKLADVQTDVKVVQSQLQNRPQRTQFVPDVRMK